LRRVKLLTSPNPSKGGKKPTTVQAFILVCVFLKRQAKAWILNYGSATLPNTWTPSIWLQKSAKDQREFHNSDPGRSSPRLVHDAINIASPATLARAKSRPGSELLDRVGPLHFFLEPD